MTIKTQKYFWSFHLFYLSLFGLCLVSCEGKTPSRLSKHLTYSEIKHVTELIDTLQSYELYFPSVEPGNKKLPLILMFDPHGSGTLAVEEAKEAAERYGYIVVGSNNSKNGIQNLSVVTNNLLADVLKRYPVDESRIYAAGFSGGGRVASSLALSSGKIRGIITCSAGLPNFNPLSATLKFEIYATAGKHDFNYDEVAAISGQMDKTDWRHLVTAFDGGHSWPPVSFINEAVEWFSLNAMRDGLLPKDKEMFKQIHDRLLTTAEGYLTSGQPISAAEACNKGIIELDGLYSLKHLRKKLEAIQKTEEYNLEKQRVEMVKIKELELRDAYMKNFNSQTAAWWANEINALNDRIAHEKDSLNRQMFSRVKGFLGIICYSYSGRAINSGDYSTAEKSLVVYQLAEPQNPDCYYYKALFFDRQNKSKEASENLILAIKLGFSDQSKIKELSGKTLKTAGVIIPDPVSR
jgi:predicted esterase